MSFLTACALAVCVLYFPMDFNATIQKNGFLQEGEQFAIVKTFDEFSARNEFGELDFTASFFEKNNLVFALVDQGSGNVRYSVESVEIKDGVLTATVKKDAPFIMTMDFVSWVLVLEIDKVHKFTDVKINLI